MRTLDKYITREFLRYYFVFVFFFVAIFILTDFFTSIGNLKKEAVLYQIILYYTLQIPYLFVTLSPISIITSTLFTVSYFTSTNQLQAAQISGISVKRTTLPLFAAGIIIGFSTLFLDNTIVYQANKISHEIKEKNFIQTKEARLQKNVFTAAPPNYIFYIRYLNLQEGMMEDVMIYRDSIPPAFIISKKAKWDGNLWILEKGTEYILKEEPEEKTFVEKKVPVSKKPDYFAQTYFPPEKMSISELTRYIREYSKSGFDTSEFETELNFKFSSPFANFILMLVTIPLGVIIKKGRGASLATGLLMSFGYYQLLALFKTMGKTGIMNPFISAWIPNLLFIIGGIYLLYKME